MKVKVMHKASIGSALKRPSPNCQTDAPARRRPIPIGEDDKLVGMVTDRDIVARLSAEWLMPARRLAMS